MIEYDSDEGFEETIKAITKIADSKEGMTLTLVAGGTASGKSTGVENYYEELKKNCDVLTISADNYYKGGRIIAQLMRSHGIGFDDPGAVDMAMLRKDIISLMNGKPIKEKKYEFGDNPARETGKMLCPPKILIVEGLFVLREELRGLADLKIFYDIGPHGWILRRIFRDPVRTRQRPKDILEYCSRVVEPKYRQWVLSTKQHADIVIRNEYDPNIEAKNSGRFEHQVKFRAAAKETDLIHQMLKIGADRLLCAEQIDTYYNPKDRDLRFTGESMRIRYESGRIIWTYKGPRISGTNLIRRPKFEFEIDKETMEAFLTIYGSETKVIKKIRTLFLLGSVAITVDNVMKVQNGIGENLGIFLEFRMNGKNIDQDKMEKKIERIMKKIGLESALPETRSYVEM